VIGAVLAETKLQAQRAAKAVKITYEELKPIITIEEAIAANSFLCPEQTLSKGDTSTAFASSDHVLEGSLYVGGQEHFYLETQSCIAVPKGEDGEMEIFCTTQQLSHFQKTTAKALGVDCNKVTCRVKRLGGGFGGKETRCAVLSLPTAVAACKCNRPVRCVLDRDDDMAITGGRHPFLGKYKVGFSKNGKISALELEMYANGGNSLDMSPAVMERALFSCDNCYQIPNFHVTGHVCKTNLPSNTAFRGFGCPQAVIICENILDNVARFLGAMPIKVREINFYHEADKTHFNQAIVDITLQRCWNELLKQSDYESRRHSISQFNTANRWKKRGIYVCPVKHGLGFGADYVNQAGALVHIYTDGSVLLSHGGIEMGQGLHTKMLQVASRVLKIPTTCIYISETSSQLVPNSSPTAGSVSSDLYGMAILNACQTLMDRLQPYIQANPDGVWKDWVEKAYFDRISLSATGFYRTPPQTYDPVLNEGKKFEYFTFGVACTEVEIDCLTGDHTVLQTDIVMDVGKSLNPAIDIGQIEGAFVQGYGLYVLEELKYTSDGYLLTKGPGNYKIPSLTCIPITLNVTLLKESSNPKAVYSSKGIGEPPFGLASAVFFAIKDAIASARKDAGLSGMFHLDSPATAERIRMSCIDDITRQVPSYKEGTFKPWTIRV
jgi:xanthine dehydrogenase/oxidase